MEQKLVYTISDTFHAELHAKQIPHKNVTASGSSVAVEITLEYDELLAAQVAPLKADHSFDFSRDQLIVKTDEHGNPVIKSIYDENGRVRMNEIIPIKQGIDIEKLAIEKNTNPFRNVLNIDDILEEIIHCKELEQLANAQAAQQEELRVKLYAEQVAKEENEHLAKRLMEEEEYKARESIQKQIKAEKIEWASQYGSDRLKKGFEQGYTCNKLYLYERMKHDIGDNAILDYDGKIERKNRSCPSMEGLLEAERITKIKGITDVQIVWLPNGTEIEDYGEPCEAVEAKFHGYFVYITGYI